MATMVVRRAKDTEQKKVFMHKVADIRGGVAVKTSELGGDFMPEGAVLSAPDKGTCHIVKVAQLTAEYSGTTTLQVSKNSCFKVGDFVMTKEAGKAYAITAIDYSKKDHDVLTIGTAIDNAKIGEFVIQAKAESASNISAIKYKPLSLAGTGKSFKAGDNIDTDAWLIGVTKNHPLPAFIANQLKGIINY